MKILVTGAKGFVGKNICWALKNIQAEKDKIHPGWTIEAVYEHDLDATPEKLDQWCKETDFVFNLVCVNRPQKQEEILAMYRRIRENLYTALMPRFMKAISFFNNSGFTFKDYMN